MKVNLPQLRTQYKLTEPLEYRPLPDWTLNRLRDGSITSKYFDGVDAIIIPAGSTFHITKIHLSDYYHTVSIHFKDTAGKTISFVSGADQNINILNLIEYEVV